MKRIGLLISVLMFSLALSSCPRYVAYAKVYFGLPSAVKDEVVELDKIINTKEAEKPKPNRAPQISAMSPTGSNVGTSGATISCQVNDLDGDER